MPTKKTLQSFKKIATSTLLIIFCSTLMLPNISYANTAALVPDIESSETALTSDQQASMARVQLPWIENSGNLGEAQQYPYYAVTSAGTVYAGSEGITYALPDTTFREQFVGGSTNNLVPAQKSETTVSRFIGDDSSKWETDLNTHKDLEFTLVWPGIGVTLRAYQKNIEKIFNVSPQSSPDTIQVAIEGIEDLSIDEDTGELIINTRAGGVRMTAPVAFQYINGEKVSVDVEYTLYQNNDSYGFDVGEYDTTHMLYIDPLLASTYVGGESYTELETGNGIVWHNNSVFIIGRTGDPTITGLGYDTTPNGLGDILVLKFDDAMTTLQGQTFLGGSGADTGNDIALDSSGNVYIVGTAASGFPTTAGVYQPTFGGGTVDVFVSKLTNDLSTLTASTFLGGAASNEGSTSILVGADNAIYIAGEAASGFPVTAGSYQITHGGSTTDAFITVFSPDLTTLNASTYLGGSGNDRAVSMVWGTGNMLYLTGSTSGSFPTTVGAYDISYGGSSLDAFVAALPADLTTLNASTYLGGSGADAGNDIAVDSSSNVYITGQAATGFPTTVGAYDTTISGTDAFISILPSNLATLTASTFLGGSSTDIGRGIILDASNNVYVVGDAATAFPTTGGAYDTTVSGTDAFVSVFPSTLATLTASTVLGGTSTEAGNDIALDATNNVYITGTAATAFPTTGGAYDTTLGASQDVFISKLSSNLTALTASTLYGGDQIGSTGNDIGRGITVDTSGNIYMVGQSRSHSPAGAGTYDTTYGGAEDVVIYKFNNGLTTLAAATYLGGAGSDIGYDIVLDSSNNVYVTGSAATGFPTTVGAYQTALSGGASTDAFVSVLPSTLTSLTASTFLGGTGIDTGYGIALDSSNNVYVAGGAGPAFPTTGGAYDTTVGGGSDAFISILPSSLATLTASTFLGGTNTDIAYNLTLDSSNNVYVTGQAESTFPVTIGAYDTVIGGSRDAFISKLPSTLASLTASTLLGGTGNDTGYDIALDSSNNVYVTGLAATAFPTTVGAYDTSLSGAADIFISKLPSTLASLTASTLLGGTGNIDSGYSIDIDSTNNVYVTGLVGGTGFPTTIGAYDTVIGGTQDAFISQFPSNLTNLIASTYLGGSANNDIGYAITLDSTNNIYLTGQTGTAFPTTAGVYQAELAGGTDAFISVLDMAFPPRYTISGNVYANDGITPVADNITVQLFVNGVSINTAVTSGGAYSFSGVQLYDGDIITLYIEDEAGVAVARKDGISLTGLDIYADRVTVWGLDRGGINDPAFSPAASLNNTVNAIVVQPDGKIVIGGNFTDYDGQANLDYIARLNADGTRDTGFSIFAAFNASINSLALQSDGKILVGGGFTDYGAQANLDRIARLNTNGSRDTSFIPVGASTGSVSSINLDADERIVIAGSFTDYDSEPNLDGIARLNTDGTRDTTFAPAVAFGQIVQSAAIQPDGKILVGGFFESYDALPELAYLARINADGTRDTTFVPSVALSDYVYNIVIQPDGKILVGGEFQNYDAQPNLDRIARLNTDGTRDTSFMVPAGFGAGVYTLALQPDGKILVGGNFNDYNGQSNLDKITRLNTDGTRDTTFIPSALSASVYSFAVQPGGKVLVGGDFVDHEGHLALDKILRISDGAMTNADLVLAKSGDPSIPISSLMGTLPHEVVFITAGTFFIPSGSMFTSGETITLNTGGGTGSMVNQGTFTAPSDTLNIAGTFTNTGTFNHNNGTVVFSSGDDHALTGATTWNNLTFSDSSNNSTPAVITLPTGGTQTVAGVLTLNGLDANDRLSIVSSMPDTAATIDMAGSSTFVSSGFLSIKDSVITDNSSVFSTPVDPANSTNVGNTTGWFSPLIVTPPQSSSGGGGGVIPIIPVPIVTKAADIPTPTLSSTQPISTTTPTGKVDWKSIQSMLRTLGYKTTITGRQNTTTTKAITDLHKKNNIPVETNILSNPFMTKLIELYNAKKTKKPTTYASGGEVLPTCTSAYKVIDSQLSVDQKAVYGSLPNVTILTGKGIDLRGFSRAFDTYPVLPLHSDIQCHVSGIPDVVLETACSALPLTTISSLSPKSSVASLQRFIAYVMKGEIVVDGVYGRSSKAYIRLLQNRLGLTETGVYTAVLGAKLKTLAECPK